MSHRHHHFHSPWKRGIIAFSLISVIMALGTIGMHLIEGMSIIDAFYFTTMIATAQGSSFTPVTWGGKIFASILSFLSVGVVVATIGFLFGPLLGKLWHVGAVHMEEELRLKK